MAKIKIITDSASDIPLELAKSLSIEVVPLSISIDDKEYRDQIELSVEEFWSKSATSAQLPKTAAPSIGAFEKAFQDAHDSGYESIICITISSDLSATYQSAQLAREKMPFKDKISVTDSRTATLSEASLAIYSAEAVADGMSHLEILQGLSKVIPRTRTFGALDTLDNLKKGGRIGAAAAFFGSLLSFKPVIEITNGAVEPESRQRTRAGAIRYLVAKVASYGDISRLGVVHALAPDVEEFVTELKAATGVKEVLVSAIGPVIGTHAGVRSLGVTFWVSDKDEK